MVDTDAFKNKYDDAYVERLRVAELRDARKRELLTEARKKVEEQIELEFPNLITLQNAETAAKREWNEAKIVAGKERLANLNYGRGTLVEWDIHHNDWYVPERKNQHYKTGRRGILQVWEFDSDYPDNTVNGLPDYGDIFIRFLNKNGTPSKKLKRIFHGIPSHWLPEGEKHEYAAPNE